MKIISGGQTGVDRAALDAALQLGIEQGGWCPKGRKAEDGTIPPLYRLQETPTAEYRERTEWNVRDGDATLILVRKLPLTGGTSFTADLAKTHKKPCLIANMNDPDSMSRAREWLQSQRPNILNVAGPRESLEPGIHRQALEFLKKLLNEITL